MTKRRKTNKTTKQSSSRIAPFSRSCFNGKMSFYFFFEVGIAIDGFNIARETVPGLHCSVLEGGTTNMPMKLRNNKIEVAIPGIIPVSFRCFYKLMVTQIIW